MMSDSLNPNSGRSTGTAGIKQTFSPQKTLRPTNEYLTDLSGNEGDYCVLRCTLPAGAVAPMHSHPDRETFYMLSGKLNALMVDRWQELEPGDVFDVRDGAKHAWRNSSQAAASMICVTTTKLAKFLREISVSVDDALPMEEQARHFLKLVQANGYWLASPEENAAVGLEVNWNELHD